MTLRILIVGNSFYPFVRYGGLVQSTHDLLEGLAERGHQVFYFCRGRYYPWAQTLRLHRWERNGVHFLELQNVPTAQERIGGGVNDLDSPAIEKRFAEVLRQVRPMVVHFRGIGGLPSSLLEVAAQCQIPVVFSVHDYSIVCPTHFLWDWRQQRCVDSDEGRRCARCVAHNPMPIETPERTLKYELEQRLPGALYRAVQWGYRQGKSLAKLLRRTSVQQGAPVPDDWWTDGCASDIAFYHRRWERNLARLAGVDCLLFQSQRSLEWFRRWLPSLPPYRIIAPTMRHIAALPVRKITPVDLESDAGVVFGTTAGFAGPYKGAELLKQALELLWQRSAAASRWKVFVWGALHPAYREFVRKNALNVVYFGNYTREKLPEIFQLMHVGIVPSVCEETYGYAAIEMIAGGIPVIATPTGAAPEFVINGISGWLLPQFTPEALAEVMVKILQKPEQIIRLNEQIRRHRRQLVKPFSVFLDEMEELYQQVIENRQRQK